MMPSPIRSLAFGALLVAALPGCERPPFDPPGACDSCPLPATRPPVVRFLSPAAGDRIDRYTLLTASATDDREVTGVEFFRGFGAPDNKDWIKLHPGVIPAAPYVLDLSRYPDRLPADDTFIYLHAVANDIEGNADTATLLVYYAYIPLPSPTAGPTAAARTAFPPPRSGAPGRSGPSAASRAGRAGPP